MGRSAFLCSNGCGREAYATASIGIICKEGFQKGYCNGICSYECRSCKKPFLRPEVDGAHGCPHCHAVEIHKFLGKAKEEHQIQGGYHFVMNPQIRQMIEKVFSEEEAEKIIAFLSRGFSESGDFAIMGILLYAKTLDSVNRALRFLEEEWERNWKKQPANLRASPDLPKKTMQQNRDSFCNILYQFGVSDRIQL